MLTSSDGFPDRQEVTTCYSHFNNEKGKAFKYCKIW